MKSAKLSSLGIIFLVAVGLSSCENPDNITEAAKSTAGKNIESILTSGTQADGVLQIGALRQAGSIASTLYAANGVIYDDITSPPEVGVDGGTMVAGGITMTANSSNAYMYGTHYDNYSTPPTFGGTATFSLAGNLTNSVPSFSTTIYSPAVISMALPNAVSNTISKSSALQITWNSDGSNPNGKVAVVLWYRGTRSNLNDTTLSNIDTYTSYIVNDNGSYTIPSTALNAIPTGGFVDVAVGRKNDTLLAVGTKHFLCLAHTIARQEYQVTP